MIEKITPDHILGLDGLPTTIMPDSAKLMQKINELVNAVNELQKNSTISKMEKIETPTENVQEDPESGQVDVLKWLRGEEYQWVGCLCELWSGNSKNHRYGILKGIAKNTYKGHKTIHKYQALSMSFEHCKPVKPDDDVIFKGE